MTGTREMLGQVIFLALMTGAAGAVDNGPQVAASFPTQAELEVDRIGKEMLAEGIPPREDHCVAANLPASELELPRFIASEAISLREKTCMDVDGVDSRTRMTFFGRKR
jgi:hypothetical protein